MPIPPLTAQFRARGIRLGRIEERAAETPLSFGDVRAEQRAARCAAGVFDFSFMGCFEVAGPEVAAYLARLQTRDLAQLAPDRLAYTLLLRDDGTVMIDATVWRLGPNRFRVVTGRRSDIDHLRAVAADFRVAIEDASERCGVIAVQGPNSAQLLVRCGAGRMPPRFGFARARLLGRDCTVARVGYTGELGYEVFIDPAHAAELWEGLVAAGRALGVIECGLEAVDALRIEAGFILFARELALPVTPYEIGCGRLVGPQGLFLGARALAGRCRRTQSRILAGLVPSEWNPDMGDDVPAPPSAPPQKGAGIVTSLAYSALFERKIALGFVNPCDRYPGTRVRVQGGLRAAVTRLPFYDPVKRRARSPQS